MGTHLTVKEKEENEPTKRRQRFIQLVQRLRLLSREGEEKRVSVCFNLPQQQELSLTLI